MISAFSFTEDRYVDQSITSATETVVENNSVQNEASDTERERLIRKTGTRVHSRALKRSSRTAQNVISLMKRLPVLEGKIN